MRLFLCLGWNSIAWSLRRIYCPVKGADLVLEIGSGGNPYYRSNVLVDAFEATRQRHYVPLIADRPIVLAYGEKLPFADNSFDFVIASHVLEHSPDPKKFLAEIQRVGKAGYIEVPDAFMERLNPYRDHRLEITSRGGRLVINKKQDWVVDEGLVELYEDRVKRPMTAHFMRKYPFDLHIRYYWADQINFEVLNNHVDAGWLAPKSSRVPKKPGLKGRIRQNILRVVRRLFSQNRRNTNIDLFSLLHCPDCSSPVEHPIETQLSCPDCGKVFPVTNGVPDFT